MNDKQKSLLLAIAKQSVHAALSGRKFKTPVLQEPELLAKCGCFITLKNNQNLRGCLGQFVSDIPLIELVAQMAGASATSDTRFFNDPITPNELHQLDIEISVLSLLKKTDDPLSLRLGIDGIYIKNGFSSGCFLPQVAAETGWTKQEFLTYCCTHKAGLKPNAWKDDDVEVYLFQADVFGADFASI